MLEEYAERFSVVYTTDSFGKDRCDVENFKLRTQGPMLILGDRIGHDHLVQGRCVDAVNGIATQNRVGD